MAKTDSIYINPLTDFGFKYLFGQEGNKDFLLSFLNAVYQGKREIVDVEFVDKERISENKNDRALIYDVHCKTADGDKLIIEMQNRYRPTSETGPSSISPTTYSCKDRKEMNGTIH